MLLLVYIYGQLNSIWFYQRLSTDWQVIVMGRKNLIVCVLQSKFPSYGQLFLCNRRVIIQSVFYDYCFTVYNRKHRMIHIGASSLRINGYYIYAVWILYGIFLFYSLLLERKRRVYSWGLPDKVSASFPVILIFPFIWGLNGIFIRTADCRCSLCTYYSIYGNPFA